MTDSIKVTPKQLHLISELSKAFDARESKGLVKFDVYDMGSFYINAFLTIQSNVVSFCTSDDYALASSIYYRYLNGKYYA